uniref:Uncharacterized protein n=1 Tax=Micrurus spixii TaxID=129469 RepID=A0A2D4MEZ3_9SAUR
MGNSGRRRPVSPSPNYNQSHSGSLLLTYGGGSVWHGDVGIFTEQRQPGQRDKQPTHRNTHSSSLKPPPPIRVQWDTLRKRQQPRGGGVSFASQQKPWRSSPLLPSSRLTPPHISSSSP